MAASFSTDVLAIGGGVTGTGVLRDLALRGLRTTLVERRDLADGTTGRYHGLLHSGPAPSGAMPRRPATVRLRTRPCVESSPIAPRIPADCLFPLRQARLDEHIYLGLCNLNADEADAGAETFPEP